MVGRVGRGGLSFSSKVVKKNKQWITSTEEGWSISTLKSYCIQGNMLAVKKGARAKGSVLGLNQGLFTLGWWKQILLCHLGSEATDLSLNTKMSSRTDFMGLWHGHWKHRTSCSDGPCAWGLVLYSCFLKILNNFIIVFVFCKWSP